MAMTTCELNSSKGILSSLNVIHTTPMLLHCDSQVALYISQNPVFHIKPNTLKKIVILFVMPLFLEILVPVLFPPMSNLQIFLLWHWENNNIFFLLRKLGIRDLHAPT